MGKKKDDKKKKKRRQWPVSIPSKPSVVRRGGSAFLASRSPAKSNPEVRNWPILRAYVPEPWSWQASGFGTAGVVREQPDGRCAYAFFWISLLDDGIKNMFGKDGDTTQELERFLRGLAPTMPPFEEGPAERAAEFI